MSAFISSVMTLSAEAGGLYVQIDSTIIRTSEDQKTSDTVWRAPFMVQDVSVSRDGNFICFTKSAAADESRPEREVGFYSLLDGKLTVIPSNSRFNFGALISPSNARIAFNYLPANSDWKTAIYDRNTQAIQSALHRTRRTEATPFSAGGRIHSSFFRLSIRSSSTISSPIPTRSSRRRIPIWNLPFRGLRCCF